MGRGKSKLSLKPEGGLVLSGTEPGASVAFPEEPDALGMLNGLLATGLEIVDALDAIAEANPFLAQIAFLAWGKGKRLFEDLDFHNRSWLTELPEDMEVQALDVHGCTNLKALPANLKVWLYLNIEGCKAWDRIFPPGLKTPNADIWTDFGTFRGPFTPNGCTVTMDGHYGLPNPYPDPSLRSQSSISNGGLMVS